MKHKRAPTTYQRGLGHVMLLLIVVVLVAVGFVGWRVMNGSGKDGTKQAQNAAGSSYTTNNAPAELIWQQTDGGWQSTQTPPACPAQPMMVSPVDVGKVTSILYPGQIRGGNYKPHGGFLLNGNKNADVAVTAPLDGFIMRGGRYIESGEVQYIFDIFNNCGVMYRFDHLAVLSDDLQKIADTWPPPQKDDSRTNNVDPTVYIKQGAVLAASVGFVNTSNVAVDWGVYDFRQENQASNSQAYRQKHAQDKELSWHAVCWFDWLPAKNSAKIKALPPGDSTSGKTSDYCT